jgi:hypothetical protein
MSWNASVPFAAGVPDRRSRARMRANSESMLNGLVM